MSYHPLPPFPNQGFWGFSFIFKAPLLCTRLHYDACSYSTKEYPFSLENKFFTGKTIFSCWICSEKWKLKPWLKIVQREGQKPVTLDYQAGSFFQYDCCIDLLFIFTTYFALFNIFTIFLYSSPMWYCNLYHEIYIWSATTFLTGDPTTLVICYVMRAQRCLLLCS